MVSYSDVEFAVVLMGWFALFSVGSAVLFVLPSALREYLSQR